MNQIFYISPVQEWILRALPCNGYLPPGVPYRSHGHCSTNSQNVYDESTRTTSVFIMAKNSLDSPYKFHHSTIPLLVSLPQSEHDSQLSHNPPFETTASMTSSPLLMKCMLHLLHEFVHIMRSTIIIMQGNLHPYSTYIMTSRNYAANLF